MMDFVLYLGTAILCLFLGGIIGGLLGPVFCTGIAWVSCQQAISYGSAVVLYVIFVFTL